ncbi:hypothetical protein CHS0354_039770 [Potamilus streckersoni]|uniref:Uncharacterized protein n=1 Tax=Potamilus streckersoni TaxID=2493646 RepID=A0AAE0S000_9BIVA|nr:hypothetical protein CHS0354_039770 [Potamilus streckersoni]
MFVYNGRKDDLYDCTKSRLGNLFMTVTRNRRHKSSSAEKRKVQHAAAKAIIDLQNQHKLHELHFIPVSDKESDNAPWFFMRFSTCL